MQTMELVWVKGQEYIELSHHHKNLHAINVEPVQNNSELLRLFSKFWTSYIPLGNLSRRRLASAGRIDQPSDALSSAACVQGKIIGGEELGARTKKIRRKNKI
jgi:hypothetical protein